MWIVRWVPGLRKHGERNQSNNIEPKHLSIEAGPLLPKFRHIRSIMPNMWSHLCGTNVYLVQEALGYTPSNLAQNVFKWAERRKQRRTSPVSPLYKQTSRQGWNSSAGSLWSGVPDTATEERTWHGGEFLDNKTPCRNKRK